MQLKGEVDKASRDADKLDWKQAETTLDALGNTVKVKVSCHRLVIWRVQHSGLGTMWCSPWVGILAALFVTASRGQLPTIVLGVGTAKVLRCLCLLRR